MVSNQMVLSSRTCARLVGSDTSLAGDGAAGTTLVTVVVLAARVDSGSVLDNDLLALFGDLVEHGHGVHPDLELLCAHLVVDSRDEDALDVQKTAVGLDADLLALTVG